MGWSAQRGWLNSLVTSGTAGTVQDLTYTRDELGRITGVASPLAGDSWTYGYDDLDRLLSADNATDNTLDQTFTYDLVGNMLTNSKVGTYAYPAPGAGSVRPHAVTGISGGPLGSQSFTYDANGSMTLQGPDTRSFDGENRLVSAVDGGVTTQFVYGPDGARLKKIANGVTTIYLGDDLEVTPGATPHYTKYLPGDAKRVDLGAITWLHRDHLQSVRALTSAAGAILDRATYRPFGEQQGFATVTESKGFIGQRNDAETGLMYLHARYYDPVLARFVQADPMDPYVAGVGVNRYVYALSDPICFVDSSGLEAEAYGHMDPAHRERAYDGPSDAHAGNVAADVIGPFSNLGLKRPSMFPGGSEGTYVSYVNEDERVPINKRNTRELLEAEAALALDRIMRQTGFESVNVNSTTGGAHGKKSLHYQSLAVDINEINGTRVRLNDPRLAAAGDPTLTKSQRRELIDNIEKLQTALRDDPEVQQNLGPQKMEIYSKSFKPFDLSTPNSGATTIDSVSTITRSKTVNDHKNHVHMGVYGR